MSIAQKIQMGLDAIKGKTYLEIGVASGTTLTAIKAGMVIGVDPVPPSPQIKNILSENVQYFQTISDEFFLNHVKIIEDHGLDIAYIDGLHSYQQSLRDVENCLHYLKRPGIIFMHDCNPRNLGLTSAGCSGEAWKTIVHLRATRPDLRVFVLDYDYGLGIVCYGSPENRLAFSADAISSMTFDDLADSREAFLNLKSADYLEDFLKTVIN